MRMNRTVAFKTLGCRLNQFETDALMTDFAQAGYQVVAFGQPADVQIVNTCTVTGQSDRKSRTYLNQAIRRAAGATGMVIATGCMAVNRAAGLQDTPGIDYVIGNDGKHAILTLVEAHFREGSGAPAAIQPGRFAYTAPAKGIHTRASVKIQDGCNQDCAYCIVPAVRGRAVSRPPGDILDQIRRQHDAGTLEFILTGVNIGDYAYERLAFTDLVAQILAIPGDFRVRLSSIEPDLLTDRLIRLFEHPNLCPHLHLCLQSGSDRILRLMRRRYTVSDCLRGVHRLRHAQPRFNITADMIVGLPGETEADFRATLDAATEAGVSQIHTFTYSPREGTPAARMPCQVPESEKRERSLRLRTLSDRLMRRYREGLIGHTQRLLVERLVRGQARGYGELYVPLAVRADGLAPNRFVTVQPTGLDHDRAGTLSAAI